MTARRPAGGRSPPSLGTPPAPPPPQPGWQTGSPQQGSPAQSCNQREGQACACGKGAKETPIAQRPSPNPPPHAILHIRAAHSRRTPAWSAPAGDGLAAGRLDGRELGGDGRAQQRPRSDGSQHLSQEGAAGVGHAGHLQPLRRVQQGHHGPVADGQLACRGVRAGVCVCGRGGGGITKVPCLPQVWVTGQGRRRACAQQALGACTCVPRPGAGCWPAQARVPPRLVLLPLLPCLWSSSQQRVMQRWLQRRGTLAPAAPPGSAPTRTHPCRESAAPPPKRLN